MPTQAYLQDWSLAGLWELGSQDVPSKQLTDKGGSLYLECLCKQYSSLSE